MLKYWIWLTRRKGLGSIRLNALVRHFRSIEAIYLASESEYQKVSGIERGCMASLMDKDLSDAEQILDSCYRRRVNLMTIQDAGYPERLRNIPDPPVLLYYRGNVPAVDNEPLVGVVGSRKCSLYGLTHAKRLGTQLARCGCTVVSGGARGVDSLALQGAMMAGAPVICVLGCGVDVNYPKENDALFRDIETNGWLVSEYPPGTPPERHHFPIRNRIISGLSVGILVVEANEKSGALITARAALEQGRDVFAVPANVGVPSNRGTNQLIKEGAYCVEYGWDVAEIYQARFPHRIHNAMDVSLLPIQEQALRRMQSEEPKQPKLKVAQTPVVPSLKSNKIDVDELLPSLTPVERDIVLVLEKGRTHVDIIIDKTKLGAPTVLAALTMLEVKHIIIRHPGKFFELAEKS